MLLVAPVKAKHCRELTPEEKQLKGIDKLKTKRSSVPAITHVDYSARVQSVSAETNPFYHEVLKKFEQLKGCPLIINTSFNVRGEPIVCTPEDAYRCFIHTNMDYLVIGSFLLDKKEQPVKHIEPDWEKQFEPD
jgi:carbamoyltransferase